MSFARGVHVGSFEESWNGRWKIFFDKNPNASRGDILDQLAKMWKEFGI